jgi:creatinine amidohydrolase
MEDKRWLFTENPIVSFENSRVGRVKKEVWDASPEEIDRILKEEFEIPSPSELTKANCYIQTTPRHRLAERRGKNDIVLVPVGCTENHGPHLASGHDVFQVTQFLEGVRRYTAKKGDEVNLCYPALLYGGHPYHHIGMPGTIMMPQQTVVDTLCAVMLGLWDDGFRKIILVNNHGHLWNLVTGVQEFCKRYQLPGIYQVFDWHRSAREFFYPDNGKPHCMETSFTHACEGETSLGLLMFPEMVDMAAAVDTEPVGYLDKGWFDTAVDDFHRPHRWDEGEGHAAIEAHGTPVGVVGSPTRAHPDKAKRPVAAICRMLVSLLEEIHEKFPAGKLPEGVSLRTAEELAPFVKEPQSEGWRSVYSLPRVGPIVV